MFLQVLLLFAGFLCPSSNAKNIWRDAIPKKADMMQRQVDPAAEIQENYDDGATKGAYPRPSQSGSRQISWLRENGGVAHAKVIEIAPGHRILVTDKDMPAGVDIVVVPPELSFRSSSRHVQDLWIVREAKRLNVYDDGWALQTYIIWAWTGDSPTPFDPYFDALPSVEDYENICSWSDYEELELHMQPYEKGMFRIDDDNILPFPTPSSPGFLWDNESEWQNWKKRTQFIMQSTGKNFILDRKIFARAKMVINSRAWDGGSFWPVLDMTDSNLADSAKFEVSTEIGKPARLVSPKPIPKGTELFTVPGMTPNVAFLRQSCHAFPDNPYEFVMLDIALPPTVASNLHSAQILQMIMQDESPYEIPHPMDSQKKRIRIYKTQGGSGNTLRAIVHLFLESTTAIMSLARASVFEGTAQVFESSTRRGRSPLPSTRDELLALDLAQRWLATRISQFPTTLVWDQELMKELAQVQALDLQGMSNKASQLASTGKLGFFDDDWNNLVKREKLKNALIFRTQQKSILETNLSTIRNQIAASNKHSEL